MLEIVIPRDKKMLERQIKALEHVLKHDTNDKDKLIHSQAKAQLESALKAL